MVEHINRLEQIFTGAGIKFTRLKSEKSFEYLMFEYQPKKKNPELQHLKGKSWPTSKVRWCTGELKQKIVSRYFKQLRKQKTVIQLVALAADEEYRLERKNNQDPNHRHPLIDWGWTEADCLKYCYEAGFDWGGLAAVITDILTNGVLVVVVHQEMHTIDTFTSGRIDLMDEETTERLIFNADGSGLAVFDFEIVRRIV